MNSAFDKQSLFAKLSLIMKNSLNKPLLLLLAFLVVAPFANGSPSRLKEMVLYFPLDSGWQQQIKDFSGSNNNGKPEAILVSNSPSLVSMQQTRELTIAVWIKPNSIPREFPVILSKGGNQSPGAYGGYELLMNANGDHDLYFVSGPFAIYTQGGWVNNHLGQWIHVAFTINDDAKTAKFYVNGQPTSDETDGGTFFSSTAPMNFDVPNNLYIGRPDPASNSDRSKFEGEMHDIMIFNRALSTQEIQRIYNSTMSPTKKLNRQPLDI